MVFENQKIKQYRVIEILQEKEETESVKVEKQGQFFFMKIFKIEENEVEGQKIKNDSQKNELSEKEILEKRLKCYRELKNFGGIVQYIEDFKINYDYYLVTEWCEGGDLYGKIKNLENQAFCPQEAIEICKSIIYGLINLHQEGLTHGNLKLETIYFKNNQPKLGGIQYITHFFWAKKVQIKGSLEYMSVEQLNYLAFNQYSDSWQLGVLLYLMLFHAFPFGRFDSNTKQLISVQNILEQGFDVDRLTKNMINYQKISKTLQQLFQNIFTYENRRFTVKEILYHEAFRVKQLVEYDYSKKNQPLDDQKIQKLRRFSSVVIKQPLLKQNLAGYNMINMEQTAESVKINNQRETLEKIKQFYLPMEKIEEQENQRDVQIRKSFQEKLGFIKQIQSDDKDFKKNISQGCIEDTASQSQSDSNDNSQEKIGSTHLMRSLSIKNNVSLLFQDQKYRKHIDFMESQISRIIVILDQYEYFVKFQWKIAPALKYMKQMELFYFFVLKIVLFYLKWLKFILEKQQNVENLPDFDKFCNSKLSLDILQHLEGIEKKYQQKIEEIYQSVDKEMIKINSIREEFQIENYYVSYQYSFNQIPDSFKLAYRAVILGTFSNLYERATQFCTGKLQLPKELITANLFYESKKFGKELIEISLRVLILAVINRMLDLKKQVVCTRVEKLDYNNFMGWLNEGGKDAEKEIAYIFKKYFPYFNYQNPKQFHFG